MKEPTVALRSSTLGDAIGIGWFLREVDGVRSVGHGGSANGQFLSWSPCRNGTSPVTGDRDLGSGAILR